MRNKMRATEDIAGYHRAPTGVEFPGHDFAGPTVADERECYRACQADKLWDCKGWSYNVKTGKCSLKYLMLYNGGHALQSGVTSGKPIHRNRGDLLDCASSPVSVS